ncbi:MAG: rhodanese-like domain-containing protein [Oscillibacter sp.]|nr:rhodanese-like domain-containing protein [Oscillibacter sp.]
MVFFDFFKKHDINADFREYESLPGAILLDVRTPEEYGEGRIPGAVNVSLQTIEKTADVVKDKDTPLFVYCRSGVRSRQAVSALQHMGYTHVKNLGGIAAWTGDIERD